jgi:Fic-DOC domain mobile mystery protein B
MGLNLKYANGQTPLDEDENEGLRIKSITTQKELDEFEQLNIEKAVEWTMRSKLKSEKILTEKFIKDLHKKMFGDVWKWAGEFRRSDKNIGIKWAQIGIALNNLIDDTKYWIENKTYSPQEIAIRFKHSIVAIHCFPNGNGRHSRMMADIIIESVFEKNIFSWQESNMVKADETRNRYITAL